MKLRMLALYLPLATALTPTAKAKGARFKSEVKSARFPAPALSVLSTFASRVATATDGLLTSEISPDGAAMPLVGIDPANQTLSLQASAVEHLSQLPGPVCSVSLVGTARDGKSTWLNLYASYIRSIWCAPPPLSAVAHHVWVASNVCITFTQADPRGCKFAWLWHEQRLLRWHPGWLDAFLHRCRQRSNPVPR